MTIVGPGEGRPDLGGQPAAALTRRSFILGGVATVATACSSGTTHSGPIKSEVPLQSILATACVPIRFSGPSRSATLLTWVDTGGGAGFLTAGAASRLGLSPTGTTTGQDPGQSAQTYTTLPRPVLDAGGFGIDSSPVPWLVAPGGFFARTGAEAFLPAGVLAQYDVVFDYPRAMFEVGQPGSITQVGVSVPAPVSDHNFCRLEVVIDGTTYGILLDTGASHSMISADLYDELRRRHPDWPVVGAALGTANFAAPGADRGRQLLRIPRVDIGPVVIENLSVLTRPPQTYQYMSGLMSDTIVGVLAGNALETFRVGIDYQAGRVSFSPSSVALPASYVAPFNIEPSESDFVVLQSLVPELASGDVLLAAGGHPIGGLGFAQVIGLLSSAQPGEVAVTFSRDGTTRSATVQLVEI